MSWQKLRLISFAVGAVRGKIWVRDFFGKPRVIWGGVRNTFRKDVKSISAFEGRLEAINLPTHVQEVSG